MKDEMFERIRRRRIAALAESAKARAEKFSPFRIGPILGVSWVSEAIGDRVTLQLDLGVEGKQELLHFCAAHAAHLLCLAPTERTAYLRDIWLNYSQALVGTGS